MFAGALSGAGRTNFAPANNSAIAELRVSRNYRAALRARWQRPDVLL